MTKNKTDREAWAYRMNLLRRKLDTAVSLKTKATLDEWEAAEVAKLLNVQSKVWRWKNSKR